MNILFLERYNNYANRIIKTKELYIEQILEAQASEGKKTFVLENVNFNPNDGVVTEQIVGDTLNKSFTGFKPDYCIVYDPTSTIHNQVDGKDYTPFESCWFVIESKRIRGNQYNLSLQRDVIRDNYDTLKDADIYVEKGTVSEDDSFIFNLENLDLNQVKQSETLLKDKTNCQWLVGYVVQDQNHWPQNEEYYSVTYSVPPSGATISWASIPNDIKQYIDLTAGSAGKEVEFLANYENTIGYEIYCIVAKSIGMPPAGVPYWDQYSSIHFKNSGWEAIGQSTDNHGFGNAARMGGYAYGMYDINSWPGWTGVSATSSALYNNRVYLMNQLRIELGLDDYTNYMTLINNYNGKVIYNNATGKYYKITLETLFTENLEKEYSFNTASNVRARVRQCFLSGQSADGEFQVNDSTVSSEKYFKLTTSKMRVKIVASEQGANTVNVYLSDRRKHIVKEPYDMFCIPYGDFSTNDLTVDKEASVAACRALAQAGLGSAGQTAIVYDVQLLPYCPLQSTIRSNYMNLSLLTENEDYQYIYGPQGRKLSVMFWCTDSEFTFDIPCRIDVEDVKMDNLCDVYRLCSPNYAGLFEFSVAKNGGLSFFNVDCSYKPFQPYIHINPNFGGLYGIDFNDSRGLICGGDFSIAIATNAWEQYKLNNKNYQAIFDREIQKMDAQFTTDMITEGARALNDSAVEAAKIGNNIVGGLAVGAIVANAVGAAGKIVDHGITMGNMAATQMINRSYKKDMFNLQNGNVKALPNSLAKTDPFTFNNKKWPFLEKYSCTDEEKEALRLKLKYNGMNVGRIGKITEYINPSEQRFFKGELIRDNYIIEDSHMVDAIYSELAKGVYL